jgi:glycopeptide antibiotics resistance protein
MPLPVVLGLFLKHRSLVQKQQEINKRRFWMLVVGISVFVTALFELVQLIIPYRAFNINDLLANGVGTLLGMILILLLGRLFETIFRISSGKSQK